MYLTAEQLRPEMLVLVCIPNTGSPYALWEIGKGGTDTLVVDMRGRIVRDPVSGGWDRNVRFVMLTKEEANACEMAARMGAWHQFAERLFQQKYQQEEWTNDIDRETGAALPGD